MIAVERVHPIYTGRDIDELMRYHKLPFEAFEGATVVDIGSGRSNLELDLAMKGVSSSVLAIDNNIRSLSKSHTSAGELPSVQPVQADTTALPVRDGAVDMAIASYSLPYWSQDTDQIDDFFAEITRVVKVGGLFSIFPIAISGQQATVNGEAYQHHLYRHTISRIAQMGHDPHWRPSHPAPNLFQSRRVS